MFFNSAAQLLRWLFPFLDPARPGSCSYHRRELAGRMFAL